MTDFHEQVPHLINLQEIDSKIYQFQCELKAIPERRQEVGKEYLAIKAQIDAKEGQLNQVNKERLGLEMAVKETVEILKEREKRLYMIKTQKEYQAAVREVAVGKKENKDREDRILKLMEEGEKLSQEITQLRSGVSDKESEFQKADAEFQERERFLKQEVEALSAQRPAVLERLSPEIFKKYGVLTRRYPNAVVTVIKGVCQGCNMNIPPQVFNEMLKETKMRQCPNCNRLIYPAPEKIAKTE